MNFKTFILCPLIVLSQFLSASNPPQISIFSDHIYAIAQEEQISFRQAAEQVKAIGYTGADVYVTTKDEDVQILDELGFQHASAIALIDYTQGSQTQMEDCTLSFMQKHGYTRLLLVPGLLSESDSQGQLELMITRLRAFVQRANALGIDVMIEDYDNPRSPCYNSPSLDLLFRAIPQLSLTFDTGNFIYCDEDVLRAQKHFRKRIHHIHLKDRPAEKPKRASTTIGTGLVPLDKFIHHQRKHRYTGWYTVEQYGVPHQLQSARQSYQNVLSAINR